MKLTVVETAWFEVWTNSDTVEGRGHSVCLGRFYDRELAEYKARGRGVMGRDADIKTVSGQALRDWSDTSKDYVLDLSKSISRAEFTSEKEERKSELRASGLSKLSKEEREALGV